MTHSSKASTYPYARFIPREEIGNVASWRFDNVDGSPHPEDLAAQAAEAAVAAMDSAPEVIAVDPEALRRQSWEDGFAQGHATGCEESRAALEAPARQATAEAVQRFDDVLATMRQQLAQAQVEMGHTLLQMASELARQVVRRELKIDPKSIEPILKDALKALVTDTLPVTVRLNPDDFAALAPGWTTPPEPTAPRFMPDASITPGGCLVEAPGTTVNATLEKRWQRAIANLGLSSTWETSHEPAN